MVCPCAQASRDIIRIADAWAADLSPLEMQNAETKQRASSSGARRLEISTSGQQLLPMKNGAFGPQKLISTKGNSTTMALSTLRHLMITQKLRRGDGPDGVVMPDSRRRERLFCSAGRTSYTASLESSWRTWEITINLLRTAASNKAFTVLALECALSTHAFESSPTVFCASDDQHS